MESFWVKFIAVLGTALVSGVLAIIGWQHNELKSLGRLWNESQDERLEQVQDRITSLTVLMQERGQEFIALRERHADAYTLVLSKLETVGNNLREDKIEANARVERLEERLNRSNEEVRNNLRTLIQQYLNHLSEHHQGSPPAEPPGDFGSLEHGGTPWTASLELPMRSLK